MKNKKLNDFFLSITVISVGTRQRDIQGQRNIDSLTLTFAKETCKTTEERVLFINK